LIPIAEIVRFALLGLGIGAVYVLLGQGLVLVYRGSGVVNFAHGGLALIGAYTYFELAEGLNLPAGVAVVAGVALAAALGAAVHLLIMRPLRTSSPLARVIATLGVLIVLQAAVTLRYGGEPRSVGGVLPQDPWKLLGVTVSSDRVWLLGIACAATLLLWAASRYTLFGMAAQAVAENRRAAAALAWSPDVVATVNWAIGGALAGLAGILVVPLTGLQIATLTGLVIAAMAAALLASFRSYWLVLAGGMGIGIAQSEIGRFTSVQGLTTAIPFIVIMIVVVVRGRGLPLRDLVTERRPAIGTGRIRPRVVLPAVAALAVLSWFVLTDELNVILTVTSVVSVMLLSIVVITGYAGQLSLAQYTFGGVGAWIAGRSVAALGWPFELALVAGIAGSMAVGLVFALPALRTRGVNLAVVTLGLGASVQAVWLANGRFTGGDGGTTVGPQTFLGIGIDPIVKPASYALFCLFCLTLVALIVANVRRSGSGRRMLAVRTNERAAASLGVNVFATKLHAFVISAGIAGLGGTLLAFNGYAVTYETTFDPFQSVTAVTLAVLGGVGYVLGPVLGSTLASGGVGTLVTGLFEDADPQWLVLVGGLAFILILIQDPNGMMSANLHNIERLRGRLTRRRESATRVTTTALPLPPAEPERANLTTATLKVTGLTVRYGAVTAVRDLQLEVRPGEVVGLIGANGAGKTSAIDAITGFTPATGQITLDGQRLERRPAHRRAQAGLSRSFQSLELFEDLTVAENLLTAAQDRSRWDPVRDLVRPRTQRLRPAAVAALRELGLTGDLDSRPDALSFGRRRLVAIARALASGPSVLLLDEPAAGLDERETAELSRLVRRLADELRLGVLLVEHDMSLVMGVCDRVTVLDFGAVIASGTPAEVSRDETVRRAYLGFEADGPSLSPHQARA
jgi:sulfate-transporting ATPase